MDLTEVDSIWGLQFLSKYKVKGSISFDNLDLSQLQPPNKRRRGRGDQTDATWTSEADKDVYVLNCSLCVSGNEILVHLSNSKLALVDCHTMQVKRLVKIPDLSTEEGAHSRFVNDDGKSDQSKVGLQDENLVLGATSTSTHVWDLRESQVAKSGIEFEYNLNHPLNVHSIDVNCNNSLLSAGHHVNIENDVYLLVWDARMKIGYRYYSGLHSDAVSSLKFDHQEANLLASGGDDGLINIVDTNEEEEDDSILTTLNIEAPIRRIIDYQDEEITCITRSEIIQCWNQENTNADLTINADSDFGDQGSLPFDTALHAWKEGQDLFFAVSSLKGEIAIGQALPTRPKKKPQFKVESLLRDGHKSRMRCFYKRSDADIFYSGGEDSILCCWTKSN